MSLPYNSKLIPRAKDLRKNATPQENHLWYDFLRKYPVRFQRQKTIDGFIADLDGSQHRKPDEAAYDAERTKVLERYGLEVLRFPNEKVDRDFQTVCRQIDSEVKRRIANIDRGTDSLSQQS